MKKLLFVISGCLLLFTACGGNKQRVQKFVETFAGYVNNNQLDSIKNVYPSANFDSVSKLTTDSIAVVKTDESVYRIDYASNKWMEVKLEEDGKISVVKSHGVASFPEDKYDLAIHTGMVNDTTTDVTAKERLDDEAYFEWLKKNMKQPVGLVKGKIRANFGVDLMGRPCEGAVERMTCTVTNNTDKPISGKDYEITYAYSYFTCSDGSLPDGHATGRKSGVDLGKGESADINIAIMDYGLKNVAIKYKVPVEELLSGMDIYTGNEYQEYLKEIKESANKNYDWLSTRPVTPEDLENKSKEELRIMRNWIFARHGYIFKSPDLTEYFSKFAWYEPTSSNIISKLNKIEQENIALIQAYE